MNKYILLIACLGLLQNGCSVPMEAVGLNGSTDNSSNSSNDTSSMTPEQLQTASLKILSQNCASCHGSNSGSANVFGLDNVKHMTSAGLIVAGNPSQSNLYLIVQEGQMPPNRPLDLNDQETLRLWILSMNTSKPTPTPTPTPAPSPSPSPTPTPTPTPNPPSGPQPSFAYIQKNILTPSCVACHSAKNARAGIALDTYASVLKTVNKKSPSKSLLYRETQSGSMPPRPRQVLNSDQLHLILTWIEQGALNN